MTITNGYCTLAELKSRLWPAGTAPDTIEDTVLEAVITGTSRAIDGYVGRRFFTTTADETRYFKPINFDCVFPDDLISITTLKTDEDADRVFETTWAATDYELLPYNAVLDGMPYNHIAVLPMGNYSFPCGYRSVQIVGKFGWASVPTVINQACLIQAMRLFRRKDAPFGVVGGGEFGQATVIATFDPDVKMLLTPFMRLVLQPRSPRL
jgi:hypothetical protein